MFSALSIRRSFVALAGCAALLAPTLANANSDIATPPGSTNLTLINGWKNAPFGTAKAAVTIIHGIVHFKGAIATNGTTPNPFVMPAPFQPTANVYVPVDLCDATNGRLIIASNGNVTVEAEKSFGDAQCLTSLDNASFALSSDGFKPLKLKNGWVDYGNGTANPAARIVDGIVHFQGAMATSGSSAIPFVLPAPLRPAAVVYVKVDLLGATNGRLEIDPDGTVTVEPEGSFSNAKSFTSLDGASYALNSAGFTALDLINGWTDYEDGSANAAVKLINGIVQFEGAIKTAGSDTAPFVLPAGYRPAKNVFVPIDMCDATNGRLSIDSSGNVTVEAETDFSEAQCFTSLDGVSFHE